ncbi:hypothetical protein T439DRAFT_329029, partial [Meredithblackwellia eburnea MCA 4105]
MRIRIDSMIHKKYPVLSIGIMFTWAVLRRRAVSTFSSFPFTLSATILLISTTYSEFIPLVHTGVEQEKPFSVEWPLVRSQVGRANWS